MKFIAITLKIFVSGMFAVSALAKAADFTGTVTYFARLLQISDVSAATGVAILIAIEAAIAILALIGLHNTFVFRTVFAVLCAFTILTVCFMIAGVSNCGCMGAAAATAPALSLGKNLLLLTAMLIIRGKRNAAVDPSRYPASMNPRR
jgi:hypothetical protein